MKKVLSVIFFLSINYSINCLTPMERMAFLESNILIDCDKLVKQKIDKIDAIYFFQILNRIKFANYIYPRMSAEKKTAYAALIINKLQAEKDFLKSKLTDEEYKKIYMSGGISAALILGSLYNWYSGDFSGFIGALRLVSPLLFIPAGIYGLFKTKNLIKRSETQNNIKNLEFMFNILMATPV